MSDNAQATTPRTLVGPYQIERLIARGGMGSVYLAYRPELNRRVALKVLTPGPDLDDDGRFEDRFRLEAETLAALDHDNIVTLYNFGSTDDGRYWLALEFIDGPRFTDLLRQGPLTPEHAVALILQVLEALRYAHQRGVVHRDLKPSNLLIKYDDRGNERLKVVDFGLVKVLDDDQSLTRAGLILGSPHCMAPEQIRGDEVDHRTDIYAIGVLLFRSLTGHWPFHGDTSTATMIAHINNPVPHFKDFAPDLDVPPALEQAVRRCLAKAPGRRPPDAVTLAEDLAASVGLPGPQTSTSTSLQGLAPPAQLAPEPPAPALPTASQPALPPPRSLAQTLRPVAIGALGALLLGGIAFLAFTAGRQGVRVPVPEVGPEPVAPRPDPSAEALQAGPPPAGPDAGAPEAVGADTEPEAPDAPPDAPEVSPEAKAETQGDKKPPKARKSPPKKQPEDAATEEPTEDPCKDAPPGYMCDPFG